MVAFLVVCVTVFLLLMISERLYKKKVVGAEVSRKIVHMGTGVIVAFTPYFLSWSAIQLLSLLFFVGVLISGKFKLFRAIHSVKRVTKGEILYACGIGLCAFIEPAAWIFTAAILHLAVADALAAVVGSKWGSKTRYTLLSHGKSVIGSLTFFYVSALILISAYFFVSAANRPDPYLLLFLTPLLLTVLENVSWYGLDNVTIPLMVIVLLSSLPN